MWKVITWSRSLYVRNKWTKVIKKFEKETDAKAFVQKQQRLHDMWNTGALVYYGRVA